VITAFCGTEFFFIVFSLLGFSELSLLVASFCCVLTPIFGVRLDRGLLNLLSEKHITYNIHMHITEKRPHFIDVLNSTSRITLVTPAKIRHFRRHVKRLQNKVINKICVR
jgi:hypothetical protein